jgi:hypothetical protein
VPSQCQVPIRLAEQLDRLSNLRIQPGEVAFDSFGDQVLVDALGEPSDHGQMMSQRAARTWVAAHAQRMSTLLSL